MPERHISSRTVHEGRVITVRVDEVEMADGRRATRDVVQHPGAVAIVAWDGERLCLVRQWRHPTGAELLEIPAGTLDSGETPRATAARELAEECGLAASHWVDGPRFYTAPGFCTELMHLFLATELADAHGTADEDEEISVEWLTLDGAIAAIDDGRIRDAKSIVGVDWLARRRRAGATRPRRGGRAPDGSRRSPA